MKNRKAFKSYLRTRDAFDHHKRKNRKKWFKRNAFIRWYKPEYNYQDEPVHRHGIVGIDPPILPTFKPRIVSQLKRPYREDEWYEPFGNPKNRAVARARRRYNMQGRLYYAGQYGINPATNAMYPSRPECLKPYIFQSIEWKREAMEKHWEEMNTVDFQPVQRLLEEAGETVCKLRTELYALYSKCFRLQGPDTIWDGARYSMDARCLRIKREIDECRTSVKMSERIYRR